MLLALQQLLSLLTPYEDMPSLRLIMGAIATQPVIDVIIAAAVTWAAHSSVAVVLLTMSLAVQGVVPPHAALALVLGANLGTALNPLLEGAAGGDPAAKRVPVGNLLNRLSGVVLGLALLNWIGPWMVTIEPNAGRLVADFHTAFNLVMAALFLPLLGPFARLLVWLLPARATQADPSKPVYLDNSARETPAIALAGAAREALRMADVLEAMLHGALEAIDQGDRKRVGATKGLDDVLDRLNRAIKVYLTDLDPDSLDDDDNSRLTEILAFITNIEHAGDIVEMQSDGDRRQAAQARPCFFGRRAGGNPCHARTARRERAHRGGSLHNRRCARGPHLARRKGGLSRSRGAGDGGSFCAGPRRARRKRRNKCAAPRHSARPQADQRPCRRRGLCGARKTRRAAVEPAATRS
jgi:phosphate:Na+ symporter